jgi:hypothetical protein
MKRGVETQRKALQMTAAEKEVIRAANHLAALLEAAAPKRGLKHRRHARHIVPARAKVEAVLRKYWARQEAAVLEEIKPRIRHALTVHPPPKLVTEGYFGRVEYQEAASQGGKGFARTILPSSVSPLRFAVTAAESDEYAEAIRGAINAAGATLAAELKSGAKISEDVAGRYLRENSLSKLTGGFSETSVERLQSAIGAAWDAGGSYEQIVKAVQDTFEQFSSVRAGMIAQTEVNRAYNFSRVDFAKTEGMEEKAWSADGTDACAEICQPNIEQGYIPIDEDFESGDDFAPGHVNCDCGTDFRKGFSD